METTYRDEIMCKYEMKMVHRLHATSRIQMTIVNTICRCNYIIMINIIGSVCRAIVMNTC